MKLAVPLICGGFCVWALEKRRPCAQCTGEIQYKCLSSRSTSMHGKASRIQIHSERGVSFAWTISFGVRAWLLGRRGECADKWHSPQAFPQNAEGRSSCQVPDVMCKHHRLYFFKIMYYFASEKLSMFNAILYTHNGTNVSPHSSTSRYHSVYLICTSAL
jgi:hypothetical protein